MDTLDLYQARYDFIEAMSLEFVLKTGRGIYVYFNPADINDLFTNFQNQGVSVRAFARQIIKNVLG